MVAMAQSKANGQGGGLVPAAGGAVAIPTLLGRSAQRIPVGGRIRAGIKVLTRRAAESGQAREIYDAGGERTDLAREHYEKFLELAPEDPSAAVVRRWLIQH